MIRKSLNLAGEVPVRPSLLTDTVTIEAQMNKFVGLRRQAIPARKRQMRRLRR
jgi:hypothetical protein